MFQRNQRRYHVKKKRLRNEIVMLRRRKARGHKAPLILDLGFRSDASWQFQAPAILDPGEDCRYKWRQVWWPKREMSGAVEN
jgi:hypothetical protein